MREEVLEEKFTAVLRAIALDDEIVSLMAAALRESHRDEQRFHAEAIGRLQAEHTKLQTRLDAMYADKLDGLIDRDFYERKASEWRGEQDSLWRMIAQHRQANQTYLEEGVKLLDVARRAAELFAAQVPTEKRRLLDFVLSNCVWKDGELTPTYRQPFDLFAVTNEARQKRRPPG